MSRILVCDDDREIVDAIAIYLEREGYDVVKAYDGDEAVSIIEKDVIDLLIIDVMMPKLGGVEATFRIREKNSLPIIILSAKSEDQDKIFGLRVGADDYMTKPFNPMELLARVQSQLRRSTVLNKREQEKFKCITALTWIFRIQQLLQQALHHHHSVDESVHQGPGFPESQE